MKLKFYKYQGTGNDFVIIDNRNITTNLKKTETIKNICDRRFGVGADGFITLENSNKFDFEMKYFNSDGKESSMCGNGGRCIVSFANFLGIIKDKTSFEAMGQIYSAKISRDNIVSLKMSDIENINIDNNVCFLNTGSPHHVEFINDVDNFDVVNRGREIRYSSNYSEIGGTNVNFVEKIDDNTFKVRTYERGVEDETLSCGTGSVASAIIANISKKTSHTSINIITKGGNLNVSFSIIDKNNYINIYLTGFAKKVFEGEINI